MSRNDKLFNRSVEVSPGVYMEAYESEITLWDTTKKVEVEINIEYFDLFLREFKQMAVELMAHEQSTTKTDSMERKELIDEIMLDKLSEL